MECLQLMLTKFDRKRIVAATMACATLAAAPGWTAPKSTLSAQAAEAAPVEALSAETSLSHALSRLAVEAALTAQSITLPEDTYGVRVNGLPITQDPKFTAVNGVSYVSLRAICQAVLPEATVTWDSHMATVSLPGVLTLTAVPGMDYVIANDRYLYLPEKVQTASGAVLLPLDTLMKALDATCVWRTDGTLDIATGSGGITPGSAYYNADDLYWLSHIINAESGNQPLSGKIAVGNVILNRVKDSRFPNSIYSVVFQRNQFTPAATGSIYKNPNAESVLAAKLCLDGGTVLPTALYFNQKGLNCWASRNRTYVTTIAGHSFYA